MFDSAPLRDLDELFRSLPEISSLRLPEEQWGGVSVDILRLDKVHTFISGNKWYKLKMHLQAAQAAGKSRLLSFGGAYSNHLHALAFAGKELGVETIGVVRGEKPEKLTPTLEECVSWGMQLEWLSRRDYRSIAPMTDQGHQFSDSHPDAWVIPEGGSGQSGVEGVRELMKDLHRRGDIFHDLILCPVGTGTTLAGIAAAALPKTRCVGFSALKGADNLDHDIELLLDRREEVGRWEICHDYHFGGFAKLHPRVKTFISEFYDQHKILLDPVYTGKMLFGLMEWVRQKRLPDNARVLAVHTGGLQGWRGYGELLSKSGLGSQALSVEDLWPAVTNDK